MVRTDASIFRIVTPNNCVSLEAIDGHAILIPPTHEPQCFAENGMAFSGYITGQKAFNCKRTQTHSNCMSQFGFRSPGMVDSVDATGIDPSKDTSYARGFREGIIAK